MAAKPKKSAASAKSSATFVTNNVSPPSAVYTNRVNSTQPAVSSTLPYAIKSVYEETKVMPEDSDHRPTQPYPGAAPLRQVQQSPNLGSGQSQQPSFAPQSVFSPQGSIQSPYLSNSQQFQHHPQQAEGSYYQSNPSPRSATSGAYYSSDKTEPMATATATLQRPYPSIYHTPQSNSPASVTSPQTHDHGRPMYAQQPPQMQQPMYPYSSYQQMAPVHQSPYGAHHQQQQMNPQAMLPYQSATNALPQASMTSQPSAIHSSPRIKNEGPQHYAQTPQNQAGLMHPRHSTSATPSSTPLPPGSNTAPSTTSNAAPGPIPATTPLVVRQDNDGVQWIAFEYSRDRVKMEYIIRCDVETVDANQLGEDFKGENCVYPRACVPKEQYKGNRLAYETDCNQVGWALAQLNPCLRGKRGLIQRAVDSWRNSNSDPRLRSRRVRRQAKMNNRSKVAALTPQVSGPSGPGGSGHPAPGPMSVPGPRQPGKISTSVQPGHHHSQHDSPAGQESVGSSSQYSSAQGIHRPGSTPQHLTSPNDLRHAQTFPGYPAYPTTTLGPSMPPSLHGGMHPYGRPGGHSSMTMMATEESSEDTELYGNLPEAKRRKFIQVEDTQKGTRVRVKVTLDQVDMSAIPDSYRKQNSVFPRAYFPTQMQSAPQSSCSARFTADDIEEMDDGPPTAGRTTVACHLTKGDGEVEVSTLSRSKRDRERKLNELGYRMAWTQSRVFANRPIFLGRALDTYRKKQCELLSEGQSLSDIPSHLETRPGKRRWQKRTRAVSQGPLSLAAAS